MSFGHGLHNHEKVAVLWPWPSPDFAITDICKLHNLQSPELAIKKQTFNNTIYCNASMALVIGYIRLLLGMAYIILRVWLIVGLGNLQILQSPDFAISRMSNLQIWQSKDKSSRTQHIGMQTLPLSLVI